MSAPRHEEASFADGVRAGIPFGVAGGLLALSFGVVAKDAGLPAVAAIVMSAIVFAGSAQFASVAILAQGGGVGAGGGRRGADELSLPADGRGARALASGRSG